jgi:hypothetical protein
MRWIAPSEKNEANGALEQQLWAAADQLRANSGLSSPRATRSSTASCSRICSRRSPTTDEFVAYLTNNATGAANLGTARDLLLPRLMSGRLSLAQAEAAL